MDYTHLSQDERYQIQCLHRGGLSSHAIGRRLGRAASTVRRELARNATEGRYECRAAQRRSVQRRHAASSRPRITAAQWVRADALLREDWRPEQIAGGGVLAAMQN